MTDKTVQLLSELVKLRSSWESRTVEVRTEDLTTTLFVNFGEIAAVKASKPGEPIGRIMVRRGLISREHYAEVLARLEEVLAHGERIAFGEVAVGLGYAKAADVSACLTAQVRALAVRVFQGAAPEWTISDLPSDRDPSRDLVMRVEAVFLDAVRMFDEARRGVIALDAARGRALRAEWTLEEIDARFELSEDEVVFVQEALGGDKTVDEILRGAGSAALDGGALITALLATGAAESRALVAVDRPAMPTRRNEPPPLPAWAAIDEARAKGMVEASRAKASVPPPRKPQASPLEQMLRAEQMFERGRQAFCNGDMTVALKELQGAAELHPSSVEYSLFVKWCQHRASKAPFAGETRVELERVAREALRENPQIPIAHLVLAASYDAVGKPQEAAAERIRVRDLDRELFERGAPRPAGAAEPPKAALVEAQKTAAPVPAAKPAPKPAPKSGSNAGLFIGVGAVVVVGGAIGASALLRHPAPAPPPTRDVAALADAAVAPATPTAPPTKPSASPSASARSPVDGGVRPTSVPDAGASVPTPVGSSKIDPKHGVVRLPASANGHRIIVDGHVAADVDGRVTMLCGHHAVRIGSHGEDHPVDVPCGGEIDLP